MSDLRHPSTDYDLQQFSLKGDDLNQFCGKYENMVFEGGGIRGIAFGGVLKYFEEHDLMKYIKRVAGSSAGAIVAAAVAIGYNGEEVINILSETNFNER
jgi:predicted acylesterase/phospholipase RssA